MAFSKFKIDDTHIPLSAFCLKNFFISNNIIPNDADVRIVEYFYTEFVECINSNLVENSIQSFKVLRKYLWEKINVKDDTEINSMWFQLYSLIHLVWAIYNYNNGNVKKAVKLLDKAIIIGANIYDNLIHKVMDKIINKHVEMFYNPITTSNSSRDHFKTNIKLPIETSYGVRIKKVSSISFVDFIKNYYGKMPIIISGEMKNWPAMTFRRWNMDYFSNLLRGRSIPVEVGQKYTDEVWSQKLMPSEEFFEQILSDNPSKLYYLAQHNLFNQIQQLENDILLPEICSNLVNEMDSIKKNTWIGPKGTVTPLHTDVYENFFCQVYGSKYIRLYNPMHNSFLYPFESFLALNTSKIDLDNCDFRNYPGFLELPYFDCTIEEGEILYIPKLWWHYVKSLTRSISVSIWWNT